MMPDVEPEQLAEFMKKFEAWKWDVTNLEVVDDIELVGTNRNSWVQVPADVLTRALKVSFQPGLNALRRETQSSLSQKKNQGFVFCGGGYLNPGVREEVRKIHEEFKDSASKAGIKMKHIYLRQFDNAWYVFPFCPRYAYLLCCPVVLRLLTLLDHLSAFY
jgi:hypothetical protein